jgi:hypothetical protein
MIGHSAAIGGAGSFDPGRAFNSYAEAVVRDHLYTFPFGQSVRRVTHRPDGKRKRAFVVGIYSSAVHAHWIGPDGATKVRALAVANEPHMFWPGGDTAGLIPTIDKQIGHLEPAGSRNNGPSGRALDDSYLNPLGLDRDQVWLSDMVPHTLSNEGQQGAIRKHYEPLQQRFGLSKSTVPLEPRDAAGWKDLVEVDRLVHELEQSRADTIISLGNRVILYFLNHVCATRILQLTPEHYGSLAQPVIRGRKYQVICLAHMRVTRIRPIDHWRVIHDDWIARNRGL